MTTAITGKCPYCGEEISYLAYVGHESFSGDFNGQEYDDNDYNDITDIQFTCAECNEVIAKSCIEAERFFTKK